MPNRVFYDSTCTYTSNQINQIFESAFYEFELQFAVEFTRTNTSLLSSLNGSTCSNTSNTALCNSSCGVLTSCNTLHHKGASRLLKVNSSTSIYTYRLTGHALCYYDINETSPTHKEVVGLGNVPGYNALTSTYKTTNLIRSIQHELSHNLGCRHDGCSAGEVCVLKGDEGLWCTNCEETILYNR